MKNNFKKNRFRSVLLTLVVIAAILTGCSKNDDVISKKDAPASSLKATIANGTYRIVNRQSGNVLDAVGLGTANNTALDVWAANGGSNQKWTVTSLGNGSYKIIGVASGRSIDVTGASTANGATVILWDYQNSGNQNVTLTSLAGGYYSIYFVHSGKVMDVNGTNNSVIQWAYNGGNNQQWQFISDNGGTPQPPTPPALSSGVLDNFVNNHCSYYGGSASSQRSVIQQVLQEMGGDVFVTNFLRQVPNFHFYITTEDNGLYSVGGATYISGLWWDNNSKYRVGTTEHEFMHNFCDGESADGYYQEMINDPAKKWDSYASVSHAEYIASGTSWILHGGIDDNSGEDCRVRMYRMQPSFYLYMINDFIPNKMYKNFTGKP